MSKKKIDESAEPVALVTEELAPVVEELAPEVEAETVEETFDIKGPEPERVFLPVVSSEITEHGVSPVALLTTTYAITTHDDKTGSSCHLYKSLLHDRYGNIVGDARVQFHKGAFSALGGIPNGIADTTLLSILVHRWELFQAGAFPSEENAKAIELVKAAIECLNARTRDRIERGVEGEYKA